MDDLRRIVEKVVDKVLADHIVREVIRLYLARPVRCAALFCGSNQNFTTVLEHLSILNRDTFDIKAVLSGHAEHLLDRMTMQSMLGRLYPAEDPDATPIINDAELLLLPNLTINTAAKIVHGIRDACIPLAVSEALLVGKPVIACAESACPATQGVSGAYGQMLRDNLDRLRAFGVRFVSAPELGKALYETRCHLRGMARCQTQPQTMSCETFCDEKLLTRQSLSGIAAGSAAHVRGDAIITPLAMEYAQEHSITLVKH